MVLEKARKLSVAQLQFGGGYNQQCCTAHSGEVQREHGQQAGDSLIRELGLEQAFGLRPGTDFAGVVR